MNRLENDLQFGRYVSYTRTNSICDHCGRTATLKAMRENPRQAYLWLCGTCESRLLACEWNRLNLTIDGSQFQPEAGNVSITPSVWPSNDKPYLTGQCGADGSTKPNNILEQAFIENAPDKHWRRDFGQL